MLAPPPSALYMASKPSRMPAASPAIRFACRAKNFEKAKRERERLRQKLDAAQAPREGAPVPGAARTTASEPQPAPNIAQALQTNAASPEAA